MSLDTDLSKTLVEVAAAASDARDDWWIIGSAAVALHGRSVPHIKDVDLLMSVRDAEAFLRRVGVEPAGGKATELFRSVVFGTWDEPPIPVEVMGGFEFARPYGWERVAISSREAVGSAGFTVFVPSAVELVGLLKSFGRQKDLARAALF